MYSIPATNAYEEGIFSEMKHLFNDFRNRMLVDLIAAELAIRRNISNNIIFRFLDFMKWQLWLQPSHILKTSCDLYVHERKSLFQEEQGIILSVWILLRLYGNGFQNLRIPY